MHGAEKEAYFEGDQKILNPPYRKRQVCSFGLYFLCFPLYIILGLPFPVGSRLFPSKFLTLYRTSKFAFFGLFIFDFFCKMLLTKTSLFSITSAQSYLLIFFPIIYRNGMVKTRSRRRRSENLMQGCKHLAKFQS